MNTGTYARRRAEAMQEIQENTGVDLSPSAMPLRAPSAEILGLFQLEKLARELTRPKAPELDEVISVVLSVKGVGEALGERVEDALRGFYGD